MCRIRDLTIEQKVSLVSEMPDSYFFNFNSDEGFIGFWSDGRTGTWVGDAAQTIISYTEMMQLLGKTMEFTKSDLKTGMFVKNRNGDYKIIIGELLSGLDSSTLFANFREDLVNINNNGYDIVAVYEVETLRHVKAYFKGESLTLIWERTEQTPAQKEMEELQAQISKLQEQAKVLQSKL
jgi:hypothetical protein